jgi:2-polyprenyl-3-methyl-5-hydroxy-6-metoxy-1,4-benzoquinol methylase
MREPSKPEQLQLRRVTDYFSASAREWQDLYARPQRANDLVLANRRNLAVDKVAARVRAGGRVLDAGCGAGLVALDLSQRGAFVHGLDVAEPMLELARGRFRDAGVAQDRYAFTHSDLESAQLQAGSFDAIVALGFLEYQVDEAATLARFRQLLVPGGILVVSGPTRVRLANYLGLSTKLREKMIDLGLRQRVPARGVGLHRYSPERFRTLLEGAGFEFVEAQGHGFVEFEGPLGRLSYAGEVALHRALSSAARWLGISRWGNDMIATGRNPAGETVTSSSDR